MYQPYPSAGPEPLPQRPVAPPSILTAVKLMYAGAAMSTIGLIIAVVTSSSMKSAISTQYPGYSSSQLNAAEAVGIAIAVVAGLLAIGLWIWMARANGAGRSWARILASVLFGFSTLDLLVLVARPHAIISLLFQILVWLIGLGVIVLLWRKESSAYFQAPR
jgi:hypothetical protein